jgi:hypothetical protein
MDKETYIPIVDEDHDPCPYYNTYNDFSLLYHTYAS